MFGWIDKNEGFRRSGWKGSGGNAFTDDGNQSKAFVEIVFCSFIYQEQLHKPFFQAIHYLIHLVNSNYL